MDANFKVLSSTDHEAGHHEVTLVPAFHADPEGGDEFNHVIDAEVRIVFNGKKEGWEAGAIVRVSIEKVVKE